MVVVNLPFYLSSKNFRKISVYVCICECESVCVLCKWVCKRHLLSKKNCSGSIFSLKYDWFFFYDWFFDISKKSRS